MGPGSHGTWEAAKMAKIKLTKNELKRQRDSLKQFLHYLPTLQLKKQQLQIRILQVRDVLAGRMVALKEAEAGIQRWVGLLTELKFDLTQWIIPIKVKTTTINIAGANVPVFKGLEFAQIDYDFYQTPLWVDRALEDLRAIMTILVEIDIIKRQIAILEHELRITTQRVNLFEKVKIPECLENIRVIRIYLGDQMANAVGISKVAKNKVTQMPGYPDSPFEPQGSWVS